MAVRLPPGGQVGLEGGQRCLETRWFVTGGLEQGSPQAMQGTGEHCTHCFSGEVFLSLQVSLTELSKTVRPLHVACALPMPLRRSLQPPEGRSEAGYFYSLSLKASLDTTTFIF